MSESVARPRVIYEEYILSAAWAAKRLGALERAGCKCQLCRSDKRLHVHHNTYERIGDELPEDLIVLCKRCHKFYHQRIDHRTRDGSSPTAPIPLPMDLAKPERPAQGGGWFPVPNKLLEWCSILSGLEIKVAIVYFRFQNMPGKVAYPSAMTVAAFIGHRSVRHVRRTIKSLEERGILQTISGKKGGRFSARRLVRIPA